MVDGSLHELVVVTSTTLPKPGLKYSITELSCGQSEGAGRGSRGREGEGEGGGDEEGDESEEAGLIHRCTHITLLVAVTKQVTHTLSTSAKSAALAGAGTPSQLSKNHPWLLPPTQNAMLTYSRVAG